MNSQDVCDKVVVPFVDATTKAGITATLAAKLVGVSRAALYFWKAGLRTPDEDTQEKLITLTKKINVALENKSLPLKFDYDAEIRRVLESVTDVATAADE